MRHFLSLFLLFFCSLLAGGGIFSSESIAENNFVSLHSYDETAAILEEDSSILVKDTFSTPGRLSTHLSDTGTGWSRWNGGGFNRGDIGILRETARHSGQDVVFLSDAVPPDADYSVEADFILDPGNNPIGQLDLIARADVTSAAAYWLSYDHSTREFGLYRLVDGSDVLISAWLDNTPLPVTHRVRLEVMREAISVYIGGQRVMEAVDTQIGEAGRAGIGVGASGNLTGLGNFTVTMMSGGTSQFPAHRGVTDKEVGVRTITDFPKAGEERRYLVHVTEPMTLAQADTEYLLLDHIEAPETAFFIAADNVTLNLNGYTITYGTDPQGKVVYGVRATGGDRRDIAIVNGRIEQAADLGALDLTYEGSHGVFGGFDEESGQSNFRGFLAAGLEIHYRTPTTCGIYNHWGHESEIRHNSLYDSGRIVRNRHQLWSAIKLAEGSGQSVHHNRIIGARHGGIMVKSNAEVFQNHIEVDSADTNALGINAYVGNQVDVYNNTILGVGVHTAGIYFGGGPQGSGENIRVFRNYVETRNTRPTASPFDPYQSSSAFRTSFGLKNSVVEDNTFITWGKKDGVAFGVDTRGWAMFVGLKTEGDSILIRDNTILGLSEDGLGMAYAVGIKANAVTGARFAGNLIESNYGNISLGDSYGPGGGYPIFRENILTLNTGHPIYSNYKTVDMNEYASYESTGMMFGNSYRDGASIHSIDWPTSPATAALRDLGIGWIYTLTVMDQSGKKTLSGIEVTIKGADGTVVFSDVTNSAGQIQAELIEYWINNNNVGIPNSPFPGANREDVGPYTVVVAGDDPMVLEISSNLDEVVRLNTRKGRKK